MAALLRVRLRGAETVTAMSTFYQRLVRNRDVRWQFYDSLRGGERVVLDVGCGSGGHCRLLQRLYPGHRYSEVDRVAPEPPAPGIEFRTVDLDTEALPFPADHFDAILCTHVIEHLRHPWRLGAEFHRVLKPGGRLYLETPNWTSILVPSFGFKREQYNPFNFYDDPSHQKPWTETGLFVFLEQGGGLRAVAVGNCRNWVRIPADLCAIAAGLLAGNREQVITAFWNVYGWTIYAIGEKP